jgi:hypothetical protein
MARAAATINSFDFMIATQNAAAATSMAFTEFSRQFGSECIL